MLLGILFLFLGALSGTGYVLFPIYLGAGFLCIGRSLWIYQARWKYFLKHDVKTMRASQAIDRNKADR